MNDDEDQAVKNEAQQPGTGPGPLTRRWPVTSGSTGASGVNVDRMAKILENER